MPNRLDLLYCDNCGTRLAEDPLGEEAADQKDDSSGAGAHPFSLPSRPPGHTGNLDMSGEIPAWLKTGELDDDEENEEELPDGLTRVEQQLAEDTPPALSLAELRGEHEPSDDLPTWLLEDDSADEIFFSDKSTDELFSGTPSARQSDDPGAEDDTPDWLQGLNAPQTGSLPLGQTEASAQDEGKDVYWAGSEQEEAEESLTSAELESWLKAMEDEETPEAPIADDDEEYPEWPAEEQEQAPNLGSRAEPEWDADASEPDLPEEDFIAWLASLDEGSLEEDQTRTPSADESALQLDDQPEGEAEAFLSDPDDEPATETPAWLNELTEAMDEQVEAEATPAGELPEWLQTLSAEEGEQAVPFSVDETEAGFPPMEDAPQGEASDDADDELGLPGWLAGVATELDVAPGEDSIGKPSDPVDDKAESHAAEELFTEAQVGAADALDFLTPTVEEQQNFDLSASQGVGELVASDDLPDWFSDVLADIEEDEAFDPDAALEKRPLPDELSNVPPQLVSSELPSWLDSPFTDLPEAEPTPLDEIPEWLLPLAPREARLEAEERTEGLLNLDEAESSSEWSDLLGVLPPPERESEELSEAEIPEWLQALKPRSLRELGEEEEIPLPEESEGPLAGLRGVLAISPVVSRPRVAERSDPELAVPEQQQQVTLLRQLAREESQTAIATATGGSTVPYAVATRLLLALLLLVTIIAGLLLPQLVPGLEPVAPAGLQASQALLDQAAGQPVIVAFDFTPALKGVLQPQGAALLEALAANNSQAILLSQSAAGAALAHQAAAEVGELQSVNVGYIPGDSLGLRNLTSCIESEQVCQAVSGRPLEQATAQALQNAALIVVLTGDQENLLGWIEQVESATSLPVMAVATQAIAPLAAPYRETGQLAALFSGQINLDGSSPGAGEVQALALAHWLAAALMLIGAVLYLVRGVRRDR